jgi:hypothetical protein
MIEDYDELGTLLKDKEHPETHHLNNDCHPGRTWWIKTVCPSIEHPELDFLGITKKWQELEKEYPSLVYINEVAFDWDGNIISKTNSVWLRQNVDVLIILIGEEVHIQLLPRLDGESLTISNLEFLFSEKETYTENEKLIREGIENLTIFWEDQKSKEKRENFKIL